MGFSLAGRVALVTGASGAFGRHFARILHGAGARVVLGARRPDTVAALVAELGEAAMAVALEVTEEASIAAALDQAAARFGPPGILVNNAGIAATRPFLDHDVADWDRVMQVDLRGAFLVAQAVARSMVAAGQGGSIVNVASILGSRVIPGVAGYSAAKAGLIQLTRQMAVELARHRIRVNALAPGYIATEINAGFFETEAGQALVKRIPQRRLGTVEDLTGPLLLLASEAGAHMTGSVLTVDGGHSINSL
ncbi:SDR family NAD(P)-dependent oxidoreductase [Falsiroseomonas tokyonensis]|uniref:SDR family NAD(P)-dependent oxidoreductase n=1 Tax=Falsiroseomonas tokyonensis TaxID=430521 RepID=A0ABV7BVI9_9PROT|nr:SDR family oxidoreductase [Falsiroseomonas tokyonensis]MBU8539682.1 SDR family oxidoreductase [Falsiroseomonas tokyonensis]